MKKMFILSSSLILVFFLTACSNDTKKWIKDGITNVATNYSDEISEGLGVDKGLVDTVITFVDEDIQFGDDLKSLSEKLLIRLENGGHINIPDNFISMITDFSPEKLEPMLKDVVNEYIPELSENFSQGELSSSFQSFIENHIANNELDINQLTENDAQNLLGDFLKEIAKSSV